MVIRYRRDILPHLKVAEITEEWWEKFPKYMKLIRPGIKTWTAPLEDHELKCLREGWTPPDDYTYLHTLPDNAEEEP